MTSQIALKYSALRFWYWRLQTRQVGNCSIGLSDRKGDHLLVGVLPGINSKKGDELAHNRVLVLEELSVIYRAK